MGVRYAEVIGDPIAHSKSPLVHKFWLKKLGIEGDYRATRVRRDELPGYFETRRADPDWGGCNVTMPLKMEIATFADQLTPQALATGAVNCIYPAGHLLVASNTDVEGIRAVIRNSPFRASTVTLIGTGGAARAALEVLREMDVLETLIISRSPEERRDAIIDQIPRSGGVYGLDRIGPAFAGSECLLNASPFGMNGMPPMPAEILAQIERLMDYAIVFDMVYDPPETEILRQAKLRGLVTRDGLDMLIAQARSAFAHFFQIEVPVAECTAELRDVLVR